MDRRNRNRPTQAPQVKPDRQAIVISIIGIIILIVCFVVVLTQDDPTTRGIAVATTVILWVFLRFNRRRRQ